MLAPSKRLDGQKFYWGVLTRKECSKSLEKRGDFLVRASQRENQKVDIVMSVKDEASSAEGGDGVRHYIIEYHKSKKKTMKTTQSTAEQLMTVCNDKPTSSFMAPPPSVPPLGAAEIPAEANKKLIASSRNKFGPCRMLGHEGGKWYRDITELIETYKTRNLPNAKELRLVTPICRPEWLVLSSSVRKDKELGRGAFGKVYSGKLINPQDDTEVRAAIKTLLTKVNDQLKDDLTREARIMYAYRHENIVRLFGVAADVPPLSIVMELCSAGTVLTYLKKATKKKKTVDKDNKMRWAFEAATGMAYLWTEHKCIHRDLAARNCLLADAELRLKISDFGLSQLDELKSEKGTHEDAHNNPRMPIKWMAPETLTKPAKQKWSTKSDVWAYGVFLYEVFTDGDQPWKGRATNNKEVAHKVRHGEHLTPPDGTPDLIKEVMEKTFKLDPDQRPGFDTIAAQLKPGVANPLPPLPESAFDLAWVPRVIKSDEKANTKEGVVSSKTSLPGDAKSKSKSSTNPNSNKSEPK